MSFGHEVKFRGLHFCETFYSLHISFFVVLHKCLLLDILIHGGLQKLQEVQQLFACNESQLRKFLTCITEDSFQDFYFVNCNGIQYVSS